MLTDSSVPKLTTEVSFHTLAHPRSQRVGDDGVPFFIDHLHQRTTWEDPRKQVLSDEEMAVYRRPFAEPGESRRPTLTWPRQIPIDGQPPEVVEICERYASWLEASDLPKLFINAEPGAILTGEVRERCRRWPNQTEVTVKGSHFIQEDSPDEIGRAVREWHAGLA